MSKLLENARKYFKKLGYSDSEIKTMELSTVYLSYEIASYAHRNQSRVNGELYMNHPYNCLESYRKWVGIVENQYDCIDADLMEEMDVPFNGVQETCLLHDVVEDTEITIDDIKEAFEELGFGDHFDVFIEKPLNLITHKRGEDYISYVRKCMQNPISAIAKYIDMNDNLTMTSLVNFSDKEFERCKKYITCCKMINDYYHFTEKIQRYRDEFLNKKINTIES